ncbi:tRNA uridine-5-carboxymethylaminomethyl(34) synthesis GTPase MnmE [Puniceibacterium sp. IMCC21224]|uniref:tRNA uridine-5-carboxymethylaminomethyl(34) synthesis GTPase MnmE n=1 Tax=Puniceibacterium sp. IMCC21224 TaxID=1618204 RepID=UPI00064DA477|nr:tRNA uridine-5-carboxymethylaminomethyl(34) synthesis GTPase MnmE [Puniceibacterium sp. IMCC21224]KMK65411.1 tRNA modification GTPase trmE [Puniceibacterium sp. IMCC21224]
METIFALATAQGKSGVAVVRVSGSLAWFVAGKMGGSLPSPRVAALRVLKASDGGFLDEALVLLFEEGRSFTGEQVVEFHLHGSVAVVRAVLSELGKFDGIRQAEAGEFTRRALENGRLDLTQVEGLADLIESETEAQRRQALRVLSGDLGKRVSSWRLDLIRAASLLEAVIDFADEDVPVDVTDEVLELLASVLIGVRQELQGFSGAERIRSGFEVAIVGAPNVGKSTLLNALAGRDAAITSDIAGTTRDVIEVRMDIGGLPVTLLDTAGLRDTVDEIEALGVGRARARAATADLRVFLVEPGQAPDMTPEKDDLVIQSKADLRVDGLGVSGLTGVGLTQLISDIQARLSGRIGQTSLITRERHRVALREGVDGLETAMQVVGRGPNEYDIAAEEVRIVIRRLSSLVGHVDVESLLDEIFASFCVGK